MQPAPMAAVRTFREKIMRRIVLRYHKAGRISVLGLMLELPIWQSASAREGATRRGNQKKNVREAFAQRLYRLRRASAAIICAASLALAAGAQAQQGLQLPPGAQGERTQIAGAELPGAPARGVSQPGDAMLTEPEKYGAYFQATYAYQNHAPFRALYSGANSLSANHEKSYTFTATGYFGLRAWPGGELYFNPEAIQSVALSNLTGLGGFSNGENQKGSGRQLTTYAARAFLRQTWGFGGDKERVESSANQLSNEVDGRRLVLTAGKFALIDIFDANQYSHDPRVQFLNWSMMTHGAYDFAADARGYTWGAALEYYHDDWAIRAARALEPYQSNGLQLDYRINGHHGDQVELEHAHMLAGQPGKIRLLAYRNLARMGGFRDALDFAAANGGTPDVGNVRKDQVKYGYGINVQQQLSKDIGLMLRASRNDGALETYAFTEIERSVSGGINVKGSRWGRPDDLIFLGMVRNGLSAAHRDYLAAGGLGFFIGDGRISYRPEQITEALYVAKAFKGTWIALDFQRISNPAYNADRGPVAIAGLRLHFEF
jgi:high affinity Mn2+ porin